jgi:iron complex transport system substrate-binding protein
MGGVMKICSLLPSSTEILYSLGLHDHIVAVTHECDYPPQAASKPQITESAMDQTHLNSAEIDHRVASSIGNHGSIYRLKQDLLETLKPDLIITQELCDVCAVSYKEVQRAARLLDGQTKIVSLEPNTLDDVLETIRLVGELTGCSRIAEQNISLLRDRLNRVQERVANLDRPRVFAMEWLDPAFSGGHWVPEMVELAGGDEVLGRKALKSERLTPERIIEAAPEIIVLMPCGFSLEHTIEEYQRTTMFSGWSQLPAVRNGRVYAVDGSSYFNRPGPRLIDGVEILSEIFHPGGADVPYRRLERLS